jgi:chemotaxis protein methyltransferase CheR/type IV pilus assembly protein PilK
MDACQFRQWVELLEKRTGISLPEKRKSFLLTSLNIRMRELGYEHYEDYLRFLLVGGRDGVVEWEILVDRLTVHETRFFRDQAALDLLRERYLSNLMADSKHPARLNVWSVGCATGEEPYSLAMLIDYNLTRRGIPFYLAITASDISSAALSTGRKAVYHRNRLRNLPAAYQSRYFQQVDDDHYRVKPALRERVCFNRLNLLELDKARPGQMDVIICQNVLIYFKREQRLQILNQLVGHLHPGGLLILGAGEITDWRRPDLESIDYPGTLAFRRTEVSGGQS